jgi:hypothetical protein
MTKQQAAEVAAWRTSPLTSKTMWTIYLGQASLAALAWQVVSVMRDHTPLMFLLVVASWIALVAITGVAGLAWTDPAVAMARAIKGAPEGSTVRADAGPPASVAITPNAASGPTPG